MQRQVEVVVLEATSDYWRYVYYTLQPLLNLMLVNPAHLRGIRGRKTDPSDAAFLARAGASGMVLASFVPDQAIRELRDLTRRRTELAVTRGQEIQRLEKELEDTGMKLTSVINNVVGVSGTAIIEAPISGERDPQILADLAVGRARKRPPSSSTPWTARSPITTRGCVGTTSIRSGTSMTSWPHSTTGSRR